MKRALVPDSMPPTDHDRPYLSIVVTSRNDGHGGSPLARTQVFLDSLADQCRRYNLDVELIIVEWNPPADQPRLNRVLRPPSFSTALSVRFIEVPVEVHNSLANHEKMGLFQMIAKNVGIRRARGEYILSTNIDILFSEELFAFLATRQLEKDVFYVAERHDLGTDKIPDGLVGQELFAFAKSHIVRINYQLETKPVGEPRVPAREGYLHANGCGDFTLISREGWERFHGYAEVQLYSIHIDTLGLFSARAAGLRQRELTAPLNIFHIEHGDGWSIDEQKIVRSKPALSYFGDCQPFFYWTAKNGIAPIWNDIDWGYDGFDFREAGFEREYAGLRFGPADSAATRYSRWIELADFDAVPSRATRYFPGDLVRLERIVSDYQPDAIIGFGCDSLAAGAFLAGSPDCRLQYVGDAFRSLEVASELLPFDFARINHAGLAIELLDMESLSGCGRLLVFIEIAALSSSQITCLVERILPAVPDGSLLFFNNIWHSPQLLCPEIARTVFDARILPHLDRSKPSLYEFSAYHEGGSLIGFSGLLRLAEYINENRWHVCLGSRHSGIWHIVDKTAEKTKWVKIGHPLFDSGSCRYSPLADILTETASEIAPGGIARVLDALVEAGADPQKVTAAKELCLGLTEPRPPISTAAIGRRKGLTIISTAKPFIGQTGIAQTNAMRSWSKMRPQPEIILFGDEDGLAAIASEIGALHFTDLPCDEFGVPLVSELFRLAQSEALTSMLAYVNADIMLFDDFYAAAMLLDEAFPFALGVGQRWEIPNPGAIDFSTPNWSEELRGVVRESGFYEGCLSADYFLFRPGVWERIPPFAIGRMYWDNWLIIDARERGIPVIDASNAILAVHQNHDYGHLAGGRKEAWHSISSRRNHALFNRNHLDCTMAVANWKLDDVGRLTAHEQPSRADGQDNKVRRYDWLMRESRKLLDLGKLDAVSGMMEELRHRSFANQIEIEERLAEYQRLLEE